MTPIYSLETKCFEKTRCFLALAVISSSYELVVPNNSTLPVPSGEDYRQIVAFILEHLDKTIEFIFLLTVDLDQLLIRGMRVEQ